MGQNEGESSHPIQQSKTCLKMRMNLLIKHKRLKTYLRMRINLSKKHYCPISPHGYQFNGTDFKLEEHAKKVSMILCYKFDKV